MFHWIPRILCILAILFVSIFALDAFDPNLTIWQQFKEFIMHLIPSFLLTLILIVAWKRELWGGILFLSAGLLLSPFVFMHNYQMNHSVWMSLGINLMINFPFVLVGILFILSHKKSKTNTENR